MSVEERNKPPGVAGVTWVLLGEGVSEHGLFGLHTIPICTHHGDEEGYEHDPIGRSETRAQPYKEMSTPGFLITRCLIDQIGIIGSDPLCLQARAVWLMTYRAASLPE